MSTQQIPPAGAAPGIMQAKGAPEPGMWFCTNSESETGLWIQVAETVSGGFTEWTHAAICSRVVPMGSGLMQVWIVEAEPGGAVETPFHYAGNPHLWWRDPPSAAQAANAATAARRYAGQPVHGYDPARRGVPYFFRDYADIAAWRAHVRLPAIRTDMASTKHMICSQLVAQCWSDAGHPLFTDGRPDGYVTPGDLGKLLP